MNEPALAEAINRLRGQWAEQSGGALTATATTWKDLAEAKTIDADVVIFPSRYLGELCTRDWLRPVRASVLESESLKSSDIFPIVRNELIKWGGQTMALPLGVGPASIATTPTTTPNAISLLFLAAPNAISNERIGVLFDAETMKPRITEPAFVDALTELAQTGKEKSTDDRSESTSTEAHLPVLGYDDRLINVTTSSHNAASAFNLIQWLAQADTSSQFARLDGGVLPTRISLASTPSWYNSELTSNQRYELSKTLIADLSGDKCLLVPRIPGIDDYLAALDEAVKAAVADKLPPSAALQNAAAKWEQITNAHGRDRQREAYQKHLGIADN